MDEKETKPMHFIDKYSSFGLGVTSSLVINSFDKEFEGTYSCRNGISSEDVENEACQQNTHQTSIQFDLI